MSTCQDCKHWSEDDGAAIGRCHRYPTVVVDHLPFFYSPADVERCGTTESGFAVFNFPVTLATDYCGEFEASA